jgi:hypothetical protein
MHIVRQQCFKLSWMMAEFSDEIFVILATER